VREPALYWIGRVLFWNWLNPGITKLPLIVQLTVVEWERLHPGRTR